MGPHRIIHNRKGYLTETYYDAESGRFSERAFPPTVAQTPPPRVDDRPLSTPDQTDLQPLASLQKPSEMSTSPIAQNDGERRLGPQTLDSVVPGSAANAVPRQCARGR